MKTQLLLKAADIVERVRPSQFYMDSLENCILGHIRCEPGFSKLHYSLKCGGDYVTEAAEFFGLSLGQSHRLFDYDAKHKEPKEAAAALRKMAASGKPKRKRTPKGMQLVKQAVKEAIKTIPSAPAKADRAKA